MDFNHPFFSSEDISIPIPNPGQHPSTPVQMLRRTNNQTYHMLDSGTTHPMMGLSAYTQPPPPSLFAYNQPPPSLSTCTQAPPALSTYTQAPPAISPVEDAEELDTSSRPRLTQEQIATLEDNFKERPKPGTDFKKHLASQIGLSLQRVNNWYQNRRAKARHQKPQERSFDVLPVEPDDPWGPPNSSFASFQNAQDRYQDLLYQNPTSNFIRDGNDGLIDLSKLHSPDVNSPQMDTVEGPAAVKVVGNDGSSIHAESIFASSESDFSNLGGGLPVMPGWVNCSWAPDTPIDFAGPWWEGSSQMTCPLGLEELAAGNGSCQTFFSTSSSDGDAGLMTPPLITSPMPTVPPELEVRRGSSSSELAKNFDTIRLQQTQSRTGLRDELVCSPPPSDAGAALEKPLTSEPRIALSSSQANMGIGKVGKPGPVPRIDLASRRKRPRPAALRPDSQRSHSCAAPSTLSPHTQVSSTIGIGSTSSVRRIRSTGQNLNVTSGGVQKPGLRSAQLSPRYLQSFWEAAQLRQSSPVKKESMDSTATSVHNDKPPTPLTPGKVELQPDVLSNFTPYAPSPTFRWETNDQDAPYALATGRGISSPPVTPFNIDTFPTMPHFQQPQGSSYPCPPQSAPPGQTSFSLGDSPPIAPVANHPLWQVHSSVMPMGMYFDDSTTAMIRQAQMPPVDFPRSLNYHPMGPPQNYSHGLPIMATGRSAFLGAPPAPPKEIEIQVNLIPKPQGVPQPRKQYQFNHTTPKDFSTSVYAS